MALGFRNLDQLGSSQESDGENGDGTATLGRSPMVASLIRVYRHQCICHTQQNELVITVDRLNTLYGMNMNEHASACGHISQIGDIIITGAMYMLTTNSYQVLSVAQSARAEANVKETMIVNVLVKSWASNFALADGSKTNVAEQFRKAP